MSFTSWEVVPGYPRGGAEAPEAQGTLDRSWELKLRLKSNDGNDGPAQCVAYVQTIGDFGSTYAWGNDFDTAAYLVAIQPEREKKDPLTWTCLVRWKTRTSSEQKEEEEGEEDGDKTDDPTLWKADIKTSSIKVEEIVEDAKYLGGYSGVAHDTLTGRDDADPSPVVNSALQPFDPPATRRRSLTQYEISTYVESVTQSDLQYRDTVNDDAKIFNVDGEVYSIPQYAGYCDDVTFESTVVNEKRYYRRRVVIIVDEEKTWRREYLDRGKGARAMPGDPDGTGSTISGSDLPTGTPKTRPITYPNTDDPVSEPVLLNGDGQPNEPDDPPKYGKWRTIPETSWAGLTLP